MILSDEYAYVPPFAISIIALIVFFLLMGIKKKSTARVSFIAFLSTFIIFGGSLYTGTHLLNGDTSANLIFGLSLAVAFLLVVPYCIVLCTCEPKKIEKLVPHSYNAAIEKQNADLSTPVSSMEVTEEDSHILELSYDFSAKSAEAFADEDGMSLLLNHINKTIRDEIKADGGAILLIDDFEDIIAVKSFDGDFPPPYKLPSDMPHKPIRVATSFKFATFPLRDNIFGEVAVSGKPELVTKPVSDVRIYQNGPEEFLECGSYIFVPLKTKAAVIGLLAFSRNKKSEPFTEKEFDTVKKLAAFAVNSVKSVISVKEIMEHNNLIKEAEIATSIQKMLHSEKLPAIPGIKIGTVFSLADGVCGDYYDVIVSRKDRVSFVMSDVAGKGMNSVVVMSMLHAMLHLVVNTRKSAGTILEWVNHGIAAENFSTDHFASCALINYDPTTQTAEIATGGTTPVYYYNSEDKSVTKISSASEPIGVAKDSTYTDVLQNVKTGDILFTYTDGLVEALNDAGQQYSVDTLLKIVKEHASASGKDIAKLVKDDVKKFIGGNSQHDDLSLLVIKF